MAHWGWPIELVLCYREPAYEYAPEDEEDTFIAWPLILFQVPITACSSQLYSAIKP